MNFFQNGSTIDLMEFASNFYTEVAMEMEIVLKREKNVNIIAGTPKVFFYQSLV